MPAALPANLAEADRAADSLSMTSFLVNIPQLTLTYERNPYRVPFEAFSFSLFKKRFSVSRTDGSVPQAAMPRGEKNT